MSPPHPLTGLTALVTGSSGGIGRAVALELARQGADLILHGNRHLDSLEKLSADIRNLGRETTTLLADLSRSDQRQHLIETAWNWKSHLDILVNLAGADVL